MDIKVREVQEWLNKTYGKVTGYEKCPEDGRTGWSTIYSLREGLQKELGITTLGQGFGSQTKGALKGKIGTLSAGSKGNMVKLIKGGFWCKGIDPSNFSDTFDSPLYNAIKLFQADAGVKNDGNLTVNLLAALFDMSAFILIPGRGDKSVREMQQYLNGKFSDELGILPCDGIYQRDTNTSLIFALQKAIGVAGANGNYGPGTISATPIVTSSSSAALIRIIQYGLYVNGHYSGSFDGTYNSSVTKGVVAFRKFMNLPPFTDTADLTLIKGLLTSNGNTNRESNMLDAATQLTEIDVNNLNRNDFQIVGRYLTGSVGVGSEKRDKNLTSSEINRITAGGLSIFPIYEDGGYEESYFTSVQGYKDAFIASTAARNLGFPEGATIYFAVDVDVQDGDIDGTVGQYMSGVINGLASTEFKPGVYGTRNVCLHGKELGMTYSFVADMSYGWSGNLGFKMPENWAFDQFVEYPIGGTPIDQGASSGRDMGHSVFKVRNISKISPSDALQAIASNSLLKGKVSFDKKVTVINESYLKVSVTASTEFENKGDGLAFNIKNGKFDPKDSVGLNEVLTTAFHMPAIGADVVIDYLGKTTISSKITAGNMSFKISNSSDKLFKMSVTYNVQKVEDKILSGECSMTLDIEVDPFTFVTEKVNGFTSSVVEKMPNAGKIIGAAILLVGAVLFLVSTAPVDIIAGIAGFLTMLLSKLIPVLE